MKGVTHRILAPVCNVGEPKRADMVTLTQYAASQSFSNGVVGLAGESYMAINQFLTVEQAGTSAVKAIFPVVPMSDAYRDVTWAGGNIDSGFIPLWLGLVNVIGVIPSQGAASQPQILLNEESAHAMDIATFGAPVILDAAMGGYETMLPSALQTFPNQAYDGPFYYSTSPITNIQNVKVPTFVVGGTYDIFQRGEPIVYNGIKLPTREKKLMIGPWFHITAGDGLTNDDGSDPVYDTKGTLLPSLNNLQLAWFDRWLKGIKNGIDKFPDVETYYLGPNVWVEDTTYPAHGNKYQRWYFRRRATAPRQSMRARSKRSPTPATAAS